MAANFRAKGADGLVRYLGGDESLVAEVQANRAAQVCLPGHLPTKMLGEEVEAKISALAEREFEAQLPLARLQVLDDCKTRLEVLHHWGPTEIRPLNYFVLTPCCVQLTAV